MIRRALMMVTLVAVLAVPAAASAHVPAVPDRAPVISPGAAAAAVVYPGQRTTHDPTLLALRDLATRFWAARGVHVPCSPTIDVASSLDGAAGRGWNPARHGECRVAVLDEDAGRLIHAVNRSHRRWWRVRAARWLWQDMCRLMVHEVGHVAGLGLDVWDGTQWIDGHPAAGVMSSRVSAIPWDCRAQSRLQVARTAG